MASIIFLLIFALVSVFNLINGGLIMNVNTGIKQAVILAIGIIMLGFCIKSGLESVIAKDRKVVVKGLAEKEVEADKVTWPIVSKGIGNGLPELYQKINATTRTIRNFLVENGVKASEIMSMHLWSSTSMLSDMAKTARAIAITSRRLSPLLRIT